ncbi:MAG: hypothetical protein OEL66_10415 [Desulfobulbaceae bacterium]|nr:hypothetical protein [Desulfobulbaceae bacterium]
MTIRSYSSAGQSATSICFGMDRALDEQSLAIFLQRATSDELLRALIPRLGDDEVSSVVDFLTGLMHKHFTEQEYHKLFLGD